MGMRINETRHNHMTSSIQSLFVRKNLKKLGSGANGLNHPVPDKYRAIGDDTQVAKGFPALGCTGDGEQLGGRVEQHGPLLIKI
jgi:hypothetical protein